MLLSIIIIIRICNVIIIFDLIVLINLSYFVLIINVPKN